LSLLFSVLSFPFVFALQQSGGPLIAYTPLGGSNETKWGIGNNDNVTITLKMRAEGDITNYVSFPQSLDIQPGKFEYITIEVTLPKNETFLGKNITGNMFALLEGKSGGQVVINLQAKKSLTIIPYDAPVTAQNQNNPLSGFVSLANVGVNFAAIISAVAVVVIGVVLYLTKFKGVKI
jgi:hypothetical protein